MNRDIVMLHLIQLRFKRLFKELYQKNLDYILYVSLFNNLYIFVFSTNLQDFQFYKNPLLSQIY